MPVQTEEWIEMFPYLRVEGKSICTLAQDKTQETQHWQQEQEQKEEASESCNGVVCEGGESGESGDGGAVEVRELTEEDAKQFKHLLYRKNSYPSSQTVELEEVSHTDPACAAFAEVAVVSTGASATNMNRPSIGNIGSTGWKEGVEEAMLDTLVVVGTAMQSPTIALESELRPSIPSISGTHNHNGDNEVATDSGRSIKRSSTEGAHGVEGVAGSNSFEPDLELDPFPFFDPIEEVTLAAHGIFEEVVVSAGHGWPRIENEAQATTTTTTTTEAVAGTTPPPLPSLLQSLLQETTGVGGRGGAGPGAELTMNPADETFQSIEREMSSLDFAWTDGGGGGLGASDDELLGWALVHGMLSDSKVVAGANADEDDLYPYHKDSHTRRRNSSSIRSINSSMPPVSPRS